MKKISKLFSGILVAFLIMASLAGCGSSSASGKQKIEIFSTKNAENTDILESMAKKFEKTHKNAQIEIVSPSDAGTVLKTRLTKNDIPDVLAMGGDATFMELQKAGVLEDLSNQSYVKTVQPAYKGMITSLYKTKGLYGVPYATNASGVLYNKDLFKKAGVKVPKTWDQFIAAMKKFKAAGIQPLELTFKDNWTTLPIWNELAGDLQPANFATARAKNKTTFTKTHKAIAQKYLTLLKYAQPDYMGTTYNDGNKVFAEGKAAMMLNGNYVIPEFKKTNKDIHVDMFPLPASNDSSKNYVTSGVDVLFAVSESSTHKTIAEQFVAVMMKKGNAEKYANDQFAFSAVKGVNQNSPAVAGIKKDIAAGHVVNYPDHYYPAGFDLASLLSNLSLNYKNGMNANKNITQFLNKTDSTYNSANVTD
ncbi:MAG: ABC transporter substrate-binding protein [Sporolactobacillus sp.]